MAGRADVAGDHVRGAIVVESLRKNAFEART